MIHKQPLLGNIVELSNAESWQPKNQKNHLTYICDSGLSFLTFLCDTVDMIKAAYNL